MWILLLLQTTFASTVLVKAPQSDIYTYQVFLENSDSKRPSDMDLACADRDDLARLYTSANDNFINGSLEKAKKEFSQISELKWNCDWKIKEREQIVNSIVRLSQIETSQEIQKILLQSAVDFDATCELDKKLYPPPIIALYEELKKNATTTIISTAKYYDTFTKILRNGRAYPVHKKTLRIPNGMARFTFVSDSHQFKTIVLSAGDLQNTTIASSALIEGDCKSFEFKKPLSWKEPAQLFFSAECIVEQPTSTLVATGDFNPITSVASNPIEQQLQLDSSSQKPNWIERNYLWVGAALVGAVLISSEMSKRNGTQTVITPTNSANSN